MEAMRTRTVTPVHSGALALARIVRLVGSIVAGLIVVGILLIVLDANPANDLVNWLSNAARWLAGPFHGLFDLKSNEWQVAVNWGLAAIAYLALSRVVARLLAR